MAITIEEFQDKVNGLFKEAQSQAHNDELTACLRSLTSVLQDAVNSNKYHPGEISLLMLQEINGFYQAQKQKPSAETTNALKPLSTYLSRTMTEMVPRSIKSAMRLKQAIEPKKTEAKNPLLTTQATLFHGHDDGAQQKSHAANMDIKNEAAARVSKKLIDLKPTPQRNYLTSEDNDISKLSIRMDHLLLDELKKIQPLINQIPDGKEKNAVMHAFNAKGTQITEHYDKVLSKLNKLGSTTAKHTVKALEDEYIGLKHYLENMRFPSETPEHHSKRSHK